MKGNPYELYISLSEKCQWNCKYCDFPTFQSTAKHVTIDSLKEQVKILKKFDLSKWNICIEGGEIGLVPEEVLDYWFFESNVAPSYHVATNGLFLEKYYEKYKDKIHTVLYHCLPDVKKDSIGKIKEYNISKDILYYTVVLTPENIDYIHDFLYYYKDLTWSIHVLQPRIAETVNMDLSYYEKVLDTLKSLPEINQHYAKRYEKIVQDLKTDNVMKKRIFCANDYSKSMVDLVKQEINRCCITYTGDRVKFTEENFAKLLRNDKLFPLLEKGRCEDCIAGFVYDKDWIKTDFERVKKVFKVIKELT